MAGPKIVSKPSITSKSGDYGIENDQLELNCTVEAQLGANFNINWMLPNDEIALQVWITIF